MQSGRSAAACSPRYPQQTADYTANAVGITTHSTSQRSALPMRSGRSTATLLSKRPGLSRAGSKTSALLVAAMQMTILSCFESKPSSSVNSWFSVCSLSSLPTPLSRVSLPAAANQDCKGSSLNQATLLPFFIRLVLSVLEQSAGQAIHHIGCF
jgi:hypothetical protein